MIRTFTVSQSYIVYFLINIKDRVIPLCLSIKGHECEWTRFMLCPLYHQGESPSYWSDRGPCEPKRKIPAIIFHKQKKVLLNCKTDLHIVMQKYVLGTRQRKHFGQYMWVYLTAYAYSWEAQHKCETRK